MKKISIIYIVIFFYFLNFSAYASSAAPANPSETLLQIQAAIDNADRDKFQNLVDLKTIGDNALNTFITQAQSQEFSSQLPPMLTIILGQLNSQKQIRDLLLNEGIAFVLNGVSSGSFAGKMPANSGTSGFLAPLFANASIGRKQIINIGDSEKMDNYWLMPFVIYDAGNGNNYPIIGKFEIQNGVCKLTDIKNFEQIFMQILKESGMNIE